MSKRFATTTKKTTGFVCLFLSFLKQILAPNDKARQMMKIKSNHRLKKKKKSASLINCDAASLTLYSSNWKNPHQTLDVG